MKILTAIGNPYINEVLRNYKEFEIIGKDIQYQEGVLEILEEKKDIDILILSNCLPAEYDFKELILNIKNICSQIDIIIFLDKKNEDIENFLNSEKIYKIYYLNDMNFDVFINSFIDRFKDNYNEISQEINDFKDLIYKNKENSKVIVVTGGFGVGKSIFCCLFSKLIASKNKKTLLIDSDIFNNSISMILNKRQENEVTKINKNLDFLGNLEKINYDNRNYKIKEMIQKFRDNYDFIIIDTSSRIDLNFVKNILTSNDFIFFLVEPNISELKKANSILEIILKDFFIETDKIKIIFNKTNKYKIAENILEEFFIDFEILGEIEYSEKYNLYINEGTNNFYKKTEYEKIYEKINI